jgi:hypothetical protein
MSHRIREYPRAAFEMNAVALSRQARVADVASLLEARKGNKCREMGILALCARAPAAGVAVTGRAAARRTCEARGGGINRRSTPGAVPALTGVPMPAQDGAASMRLRNPAEPPRSLQPSEAGTAGSRAGAAAAPIAPLRSARGSLGQPPPRRVFTGLSGNSKPSSLLLVSALHLRAGVLRDHPVTGSCL